MRKFTSAIILTGTLFIFSGCMHRPVPNLPAHWQGKPIPMASLEDPETDKMYVFVMYDKRMCAHTILRIHSPEHGTVFWDPAGGYGKPDIRLLQSEVTTW